jgi:hypothetical protein
MDRHSTGIETGAGDRRKRRQLHIWLSDDDHAFLLRHAAEQEETVGMILRRLIKLLKRGVPKC